MSQSLGIGKVKIEPRGPLKCGWIGAVRAVVRAKSVVFRFVCIVFCYDIRKQVIQAYGCIVSILLGNY